MNDKLEEIEKLQEIFEVLKVRTDEQQESLA